jgi:hypothetical protein
MPIDPEQPALILDALRTADTVDARAIDVAVDGETLVLRGSVATFEESAAAASLAQAHAETVRSDLTVDVNLREGLDQREPATVAADTPGGQADDLVDDLQESLQENLPWDPPTEEVQVPTRAEARGIAGANGGDAVDDGAPPATKSLPDVTADELSRAAHPQARDRDEETA